MTDTLKLTLLDDHCVIDMCSEVTERAALEIESAFEKLFSYYKYERAVFRVNSPGGLLSALRHILEYVENWRATGVKIETQVTFCAASAAAVLVSFGEIGTRTAHRHSSMLYHHSRIGGTASVITASGANYLASLLKSTDHGLVNHLVSHIARGLGGPILFASQGEMRCKLLATQGATIAHKLELNADVSSLRWLKPTANMFRELGKKGSLDLYRRHLARRMDADTSMDLREAYALCLIDCVHGVPELCKSPGAMLTNQIDEVLASSTPEKRKSSNQCQPILLADVEDQNSAEAEAF